MKNNLLKSVAAAATASALLFSTVTSFAAATATTVTTYSGSTVSVSSTITGVAANTMVTYLASANSDGSVSKSGDILYIGQKTSDGSNAITFNYNLPSSVTATAGNVLAKVKYGASDKDTAKALNSDASTEVKYGTLTIVKNNCDISVNGTTLTEETTPSIGNGETVVFGIEPSTGYEVKEVYLDGTPKTDVSDNKVSVKYSSKDMELVVICGAVVKDDSAPVVVPVMSISETNVDQVGLICHKTGNAESFGVYATYGGNNTPFVMDSYNGYFPATVDEDGFYAVQILNDKDGYELPDDLILVPAYRTSNNEIYVFGSTDPIS